MLSFNPSDKRIFPLRVIRTTRVFFFVLRPFVENVDVALFLVPLFRLMPSVSSQ